MVHKSLSRLLSSFFATSTRRRRTQSRPSVPEMLEHRTLLSADPLVGGDLISEDDRHGDTIADAADLELHDGRSAAASGFVNSPGDVDVFRVTASADGLLHIQGSGYAVDTTDRPEPVRGPDSAFGEDIHGSDVSDSGAALTLLPGTHAAWSFLDFVGDTDVLQFTAPESGTIAVSTVLLPFEASDGRVMSGSTEVLSADGTVLASPDAGGMTIADVTEGQTYFLRVSAGESDVTAEYIIDVVPTHGEGFPAAEPVDRRLKFEVLDTGGTVVAEGSTPAPVLAGVEVAAGDSFYVRISGAADPLVGEYEFDVTLDPSDDNAPTEPVRHFPTTARFVLNVPEAEAEQSGVFETAGYGLLELHPDGTGVFLPVGDIIYPVESYNIVETNDGLSLQLQPVFFGPDSVVFSLQSIDSDAVDEYGNVWKRVADLTDNSVTPEPAGTIIQHFQEPTRFVLDISDGDNAPTGPEFPMAQIGILELNTDGTGFFLPIGDIAYVVEFYNIVETDDGLVLQLKMLGPGSVQFTLQSLNSDAVDEYGNVWKRTPVQPDQRPETAPTPPDPPEDPAKSYR